MVRWLKLVPVLIISLFLFSHSVWADDPYSVYIDGKQLPLSSEPVNVNGSLLVPMRDLFQGLGAQVTWDEGSQRVFAVKDKMLLILPLNNDYVYFNQRSVKLTVQARLIGERTFVPLRFVSTIFGSQVDYDAATERIDIATQVAPLQGDAAQRLTQLEASIAATNQISSYQADLTGQYDITLGNQTMPIALQANSQVAGDTEMSLSYKMSSSASPTAAVEGDMVVSGGKLYLKSGNSLWTVQPLGSDADSNDLVRSLVGSVTNGNLETLPLAELFGSTMVPKDGFLKLLNERGLLQEVNDLGAQDVNGMRLNGLQLVFAPQRFIYYFSNIGGNSPQAQGKVLDNVQGFSLVVNYWASPDDQLVYKTDIDLQIVMKADPYTPMPSAFSLRMSQVLKSPNQVTGVVVPSIS